MGMKHNAASIQATSLADTGEVGVGLDSEDPPGHCLWLHSPPFTQVNLWVLGSCLPCPLLGQAGPALTDVVKASRCQPLRQVRGEEKTSEQRAQQVVAMTGAQRLLPTAVAPAPAQSQLAKEKQAEREGLAMDPPVSGI